MAKASNGHPLFFPTFFVVLLLVLCVTQMLNTSSLRLESSQKATVLLRRLTQMGTPEQTYGNFIYAPHVLEGNIALRNLHVLKHL